MATLAVGALGGGLGFLAGGPAGAALGFSIGSVVGGILFPPSMGDQSRGKLDDLRLTGAGYGSAIPQVWGKQRIGGNTFWVKTDANGSMLTEHTNDTSVGGKGGIGGGSAREYTYSATFAVEICRGPITAVTKIWAEGVVIYDASAGTPTKYDIRFKFGTAVQTPESGMEGILGTGNSPAYRGIAYAVFYDIDLSQWGNRMPQLSFEVDAGAATVGSILTDIFTQCGLVAGDFDVTAGTDSVRGMSWGSRSEARSVIESLLRFYQIDLAEIDGKIVAIKRGTASSLTIPYADMGAMEDSAENPVAVQTRMQDIEIPRRIDLTYYDVDNAFAAGSQGATRQTKTWIQDSATEDTPLALNANEARQGAERMLYTSWNERHVVSVALQPKYFDIAPGRVVTLQMQTGNFIGRVVEVMGSVTGPMTIKVVQDDATVITQGVSGGTSPGLPIATQAVVPTTFYAWSGVEIRDEDTFQPGFYVVGTGPAGWQGAVIYYSADGGANYSQVGSLSDRGEFGTCNTTLGNGVNTTSWDATNTVDVTLQVTGSLTSDSQNNVLNNTYVNKALIGGEIIGYATVALVSALRYTLSSLRRGYRSTPFTGHVASEKWVHLTQAIVRVPLPTFLVGSSVLVKCVSPGQTLAAVTAQTITITTPNSIYATIPGVASTALSGAAMKSPVRAISLSNITLSGTQTIDGVALAVGESCAVNGQTTGSQNGIYIVSAGAWTRRADADTSAKMFASISFFVSEGTLNHDTLWSLKTNDPITLGTTSLLFEQYAPVTSGGSTTLAFYRQRFAELGFAGAKLDSTYFINAGVNIPTGKTIRYSPRFVDGPGGDMHLSVGDTQLVFWNRIGIQNTTGGDITITFNVRGHDDSLVIVNQYGTNMAGTVNVNATTGVVTGSGTALSTNFVTDDYIFLTLDAELLRFTATPGSATSGNTAIGLGANAPNQQYRLGKTIYAQTANNAAVNGNYTAIIKAGTTHILNLFGNNNTGSGYWIIDIDAFTLTGLVFVDPGA